MTRRLALAVIAVSFAACSSSYDAGGTAEEQLCDVLETTLAAPSTPDGVAFEALLEEAAADPTDMPADLNAVALSYRTNEDAYDLLGPYEPAIVFATNLVELSQSGLIGPSELSPRVLDSAVEIDATLAACN